MNKTLVIAILNAYAIINDGCMSILTDDKTFNDCRVSDMDISLVWLL